MFTKLTIVRILDFMEVVLVELPHEGGEVAVLEHAREDGFREFVHVLWGGVGWLVEGWMGVWRGRRGGEKGEREGVWRGEHGVKRGAI